MCHDGRMADESGAYAEAARDASSRREYEAAAIDHLLARVGADVAMFVWPSGPSEYAHGFHDSVRSTAEKRWGLYASELSGLSTAALAGGGVVVDTEYFDTREHEKLHYYQEIMRPHRGRTTLMGYLTCGGARRGALVLGRTSRNWSAGERAYIERVLPVLGVCAAALQPSRERPQLVTEQFSLTPREREVLSYLELGYTNAEIALACGTKMRTVRNQMSQIFSKLGASTRAEAVAISLRSR
jgi:DNA-binding CsgD family transcriptional regulator